MVSRRVEQYGLTPIVGDLVLPAKVAPTARKSGERQVLSPEIMIGRLFWKHMRKVPASLLLMSIFELHECKFNSDMVNGIAN